MSFKAFAFVIVTTTIHLITVPLGAQTSATDQWRSAVSDSSTIVFAQLDLEALDPTALTQSLSASLPQEQMQGVNLAGALVQGLVQQLRQSGAKEVFLAASASQLVTDGVVLVPCQQPAAARNVLAMLAMQLPKELQYQVHQTEDAVALCRPQRWERLLAARKAGNSDETWQARMQRAPEPYYAIAALPDRLREELVALWPQQIEVFGKLVSPSELARDVTATRIGIVVEPRPVIALHLECVDKEAVSRVQGQVKEILGGLPKEIEGMQLPQPEFQVQANTLSLVLDATSLQTGLSQAISRARSQAAEQKVASHLKQIMLAMHLYIDAAGKLPSPSINDANGKPLLSWRVQMLPYLGEQELYARFRLNEAWDSDHNAKLIGEMPAIYGSVDEELAKGMTLVRMPQLPGSLWSTEALRLSQVTDGTSQTVAIVMAPKAAAVIWTKPDVWPISEQNIQQDLFGDAEGTWVSLLDGSAHRYERDIDAKKLKALLTYAGGEVINE